MLEEIILENSQDPHTHMRGHILDPDHQANKILDAIGPMQKYFSRILAMPNVLPGHIRTGEDIVAYRKLLEQAMPIEKYATETIFTISLKPETTPETIISAKKMGMQAVKYYPGGVTTNSGGTSGDLDISHPETHAVLECMQQEGIVLCLHPETTHQINEYGHTIKGFVHDAEREFKGIIEQLAETYPKLKIVVEHISTKENAELVGNNKYSNLYCTVTPQHLMLTAHDKEGGHGFDPHIHCKPTLKKPEDQIAIQKLVLSGNKNVCFGSDSAPHPIDTKEAAHCSAGVFSSPIAIELVTNWFFDPKTIKFGMDNGLLKQEGYLAELAKKLQAFIGDNANNIYGEPNTESKKIITLRREPFIIPDSYGDKPKIVPMWAGKELAYSIVEATVQTGDEIRDLINI